MNDRELREGQDKIYKCLPGQNAITQCKGDVDGVTYHFDKVCGMWCVCVFPNSFPLSLHTTPPHLSTLFNPPAPLPKPRSLHIEQVFDETIQTHTVYQNIATEIVKGVTMGINGTIFA